MWIAAKLNFIFLLFISLTAVAQKSIVVKSPDGNISLDFTATKTKLFYKVAFKKYVLIDQSSLSLDFKDDASFGAEVKVKSVKYSKVSENYELTVGKTKIAKDDHNQALILLEEASGEKRKINLQVRVFNDGVAFRYQFPTQENWSAYTLTDEKTNFNIVGNPKVRTLIFKNYTSSHEGLYQKKSLSEIKEGELLDMPALFEFADKYYMAITEANLRDYAGMYLTKKDDVLQSQLSPWPGQALIKVKAILPHQTPWRVMMISEKPGNLIASNILTSLNEPSKIKDFSWLKPGKTSFHWWNGDVVPDTNFVPGANFETNKYYIDFCARNNIEYHSVIGYGGFAWYSNDWPNYGHQGTYADVTKPIAALDMQKICDYAKSKGVGIHVWVNWKALYPQLDVAFAQFEKWGIQGMMVDFLDRDDQEMVNIQEEILQKAADHHLFIQFHGAYKPTGLNRTYPNEFTREGTWNYEQNKWRATAITPEHDLDIAFTRLIAGASDYHLGGFRAVKNEDFKTHYIRPLMTGTRSHMLAMYVVLESYLTMVADYPEAYEGQPGFEFLRKVPTVWDETKVLDGHPDQFLTVARKKDDVWYVGSINNSVKKTISIKLDFLGDGDYILEQYKDAPDVADFPNHLTKTQDTVKKNQIIDIELAVGGGQAMIITKKN